MNQPKKCYQSIECPQENTKIWYNHYRGCIVKSWIDPGTNLIMQERVPYNQPSHFLRFLDNYFKYDLH